MDELCMPTLRCTSDLGNIPRGGGKGGRGKVSAGRDGVAVPRRECRAEPCSSPFAGAHICTRPFQFSQLIANECHNTFVALLLALLGVGGPSRGFHVDLPLGGR